MIIIVSIILILLIIAGCIYRYSCEKRQFNNGICPNCGTVLRHFDTDSQGGKGFTCDICGYTTWVSWFNPDKKK